MVKFGTMFQFKPLNFLSKKLNIEHLTLKSNLYYSNFNSIQVCNAFQLSRTQVKSNRFYSSSEQNLSKSFEINRHWIGNYYQSNRSSFSIKRYLSHSQRYTDAHQLSISDPDKFWKPFVDSLVWSKKPTKAYNKDTNLWFEDGLINLCENCLDIHVKNGNGDKIALIWESPVTFSDSISITYNELLEKVKRAAWVLKNKGNLESGDRVILYMPMVPEAIITMLACQRLGVTHSIVFGGFSPSELSARIQDCEPKMIIAASAGFEPKGKVVHYKEFVDEAINISGWKGGKGLILRRDHVFEKLKIPKLDYNLDKLPSGMEFMDWDEEMKNAKQIEHCTPMPSNHPAYILYTSGSTSKPKGVSRPVGGHIVQLLQSMKHIFGTKSVILAASDIGWVVGHSYSVYGPLLNGNTTIIYEGKPINTPDDRNYWRLIEKHKIETLFAAPTAFRAIKQSDPEGKGVKEFSLDSLKSIFVAGERCDEDTFKWLQKITGKIVIDNYWQTETGSPILATCLGLEDSPIKNEMLIPGSAGPQVPGFNVYIVDKDENGVIHHLETGKEGQIVIKLPLPPGSLSGLWRNKERFFKSYFETYPGYFDTGDTGSVDQYGNFFVSQRADDIIQVAAHRLSTSSMESSLTSVPGIAEAAVVGIPEPIKGMIPIGLVILSSNCTLSEKQIETAAVNKIRNDIGAIAAFKHCLIVKMLPKTRSGKVLRRTIRSILKGEEIKEIPATIENPAAIDHIQEVAKSNGFPLKF